MKIRTFENLPADPHHSPERACAGVSTDVFFPASAVEAIAAQQICASCPVLTRCAEWGLREPLTDAVVASVWMPRKSAPAKDKRAARALLRQVAATGATRLDELKAVA